jgi:hypothetical protein
MNTRALILLFPMPTSIWIRGRLSFFTSKISGNIFYFLICFWDKHFIFNLFNIAANGFIFECRELQHTECCVSVLGRISIEGRRIGVWGGARVVSARARSIVARLFRGVWRTGAGTNERRWCPYTICVGERPFSRGGGFWNSRSPCLNSSVSRSPDGEIFSTNSLTALTAASAWSLLWL